MSAQAFAEPTPHFTPGPTVPGSDARRGRLHTAHGTLHTPAFVAVATRGTVKALGVGEVRALGVQALIGNTYHLTLRPGPELVRDLGGLHGFSGWSGPWMTDSGGYQVFSLGAGKEHGVGKLASAFPGDGVPRVHGTSLVRLDEAGTRVRSIFDGAWVTFTPESVIRTQRLLGADVVLPLDECTSPYHPRAYTQAACERTHRWAERALTTWRETEGQGPNPGQVLYGIVQGGVYEDLRRHSAATIAGMGFPGIAIGGSLGRTKQDMYRIISWCVDALPYERPRHLLGIGTVEDILEAVRRGMDTFDCAGPTRMARNGSLLSLRDPSTRINIRASRFRRDPSSVDPTCDCPTCTQHSRAFLHHLLRSGELAFYPLATAHNLRVMVRTMATIRSYLDAGRMPALKDLADPS